LALGACCALPAAALAQAPASYPAEASHMTLVGHVALTSGGEGYAMKLAGSRRLLYVAHESGPECLSIIDVTDPAHASIVRTIETASPVVRCNSLDVNGNILVVAAETKKQGEPGGGFRVYTLDDPTNPKLAAYFDTTGPHSRGAHHVWLSDEKTVNATMGAPDFTPNRSEDDEYFRTVDISDPAHPKPVGDWWYPGQRAGDAAPAPRDLPMAEMTANAVRSHDMTIYPSHPNRAYVGYLDEGIVILDISDRAHPKMVGNVRYVGPFTHTVLPLFSRNLLFTTEEATADNCGDDPKRMTVWDDSDEAKPRLLSVVPYAADSASLCKRGGRFGPHNVYENKPYGPSWHSDRYVVTTWFGGGVRIFDLADPSNPKEAAYYVPATPVDSPKHAPQLNDVFVDDRGYIYSGDRFTGGLYILKSDVIAPQK
jgi:hypothetical protein